jgi:hypothetical protein
MPFPGRQDTSHAIGGIRPRRMSLMGLPERTTIRSLDVPHVHNERQVDSLVGAATKFTGQTASPHQSFCSFKRKYAVGISDFHAAAFAELLLKHLDGQRVLDALLNDTFQRAGTVGRVVAFLGDRT